MSEAGKNTLPTGAVGGPQLQNYQHQIMQQNGNTTAAAGAPGAPKMPPLLPRGRGSASSSHAGATTTPLAAAGAAAGGSMSSRNRPPTVPAFKRQNSIVPGPGSAPGTGLQQPLQQPQLQQRQIRLLQQQLVQGETGGTLNQSAGGSSISSASRNTCSRG
ncbi:unnamed protein product, partial [Amoebophrya sp. A120]|eukprot:GSA120T00007194001.1